MHVAKTFKLLDLTERAIIKSWAFKVKVWAFKTC